VWGGGVVGGVGGCGGVGFRSWSLVESSGICLLSLEICFWESARYFTRKELPDSYMGTARSGDSDKGRNALTRACKSELRALVRSGEWQSASGGECLTNRGGTPQKAGNLVGLGVYTRPRTLVFIPNSRGSPGGENNLTSGES